MLVTHDGVLLHVDYGFILGELGRDMHHYINYIHSVFSLAKYEPTVGTLRNENIHCVCDLTL